jgi:hypothetical protein
MAPRYRWLTVQDTASRIGSNRWAVLMLALHHELVYRPTAQGIELRLDSVEKYVAGMSAAHHKSA